MITNKGKTTTARRLIKKHWRTASQGMNILDGIQVNVTSYSAGTIWHFPFTVWSVDDHGVASYRGRR